MEQKNKLKLNSGGLLVFILTVGVFGIINTEMGVVGILPLIAETFNVSILTDMDRKSYDFEILSL